MEHCSGSAAARDRERRAGLFVAMASCRSGEFARLGPSVVIEIDDDGWRYAAPTRPETAPTATGPARASDDDMHVDLPLAGADHDEDDNIDGTDTSSSHWPSSPSSPSFSHGSSPPRSSLHWSPPPPRPLRFGISPEPASAPGGQISIVNTFKLQFCFDCDSRQFSLVILF